MKNETEIINYQSEQIVLNEERKKEYVYFNITDDLVGSYTYLPNLPYFHLFIDFELEDKLIARLASFKAITTIYKTDVNGARTLANRRETMDINERVACTIPVRAGSYQGPELRSLDFNLEITVEESPVVKIQYENVFVKTDVNNTPLEVEGKIIYVNKGFLSVHSNYFKCLFSKEYIDSTKPVIPVKLGTLEELGLLFSVFYPPYITEIQDEHIIQLLELAVRFQVPAVTEKVESYLAEHAVLNKAKKLWMAEKFGLPKVTEKVLCQIKKSAGQDKVLMSMKHSKYYSELSDGLKEKLENIRF
ncbi:hypothetical protein CAEBREN_19138 [Caenorhabditis brenneri]|uniref:BTB domain-containing protein n=1 Tax=Caenorhabditis brenneri TaxID=135651 RepID=G0NC86_CAEBE|nr:hypothetical protein CAEBREN_19138 [Caenorhabditis brenneri]